jgi:hypothetical protein
MKKAGSLYREWRDEVDNVQNLRSNRSEVKDNLEDLNSGEITLFGLLAEGGKGLDTPKNSEYIAVEEGSDKAETIRESGSYSRSKLHMIVDDEQIADIDELTKREKEKGINQDSPHWVKVTRETGEEDRFYCTTNEYINWSKKSVAEIKDEGNLRNSDYYFERGVSTKMGGGVRDPVWMIIEPSVFTSVNQVFTPIIDSKTSLEYLVGVMNSNVVRAILNNFLNRIGQSTRDVRKIPLKLPTDKEQEKIEEQVEKAIELQKGNETLSQEQEEKIEEIRENINEITEEIYGVELDE